MEGGNFFNKVKKGVKATTLGVLAFGMSSKMNAADNSSSVMPLKDTSNKVASINNPEAKWEDKNYKIDTMKVSEKNGQQYMLLKLSKTKGEYSSYQEVIEAVKKINPDIRFLTPEETQNFLEENEKIPKRSYYVSLGADVTGSSIDIKAASGAGVQFNAYKFGPDGKIISAGSSFPSDNDYLFTASIKSKVPDNTYTNLTSNNK